MSSTEDLFYEDLAIGDRWQSPTRAVNEAEIIGFANLTGDQDPLHVDPAFAAETPFRKQIAHGLLGLSFMAGLCSKHPRVQTAAFLKIENWSFLNPIFIGDEIHAVNEIVALDDHGRRHGMVHWRRQILNGKNEVVQEGELVTLVSRRSPLRVYRMDSGHASFPSPKMRPTTETSPTAKTRPER
jgi:acyl dehydratase